VAPHVTAMITNILSKSVFWPQHRSQHTRCLCEAYAKATHRHNVTIANGGDGAERKVNTRHVSIACSGFPKIGLLVHQLDSIPPVACRVLRRSDGVVRNQPRGLMHKRAAKLTASLDPVTATKYQKQPRRCAPNRILNSSFSRRNRDGANDKAGVSSIVLSRFPSLNRRANLSKRCITPVLVIGPAAARHNPSTTHKHSQDRDGVNSRPHTTANHKPHDGVKRKGSDKVQRKPMPQVALGDHGWHCDLELPRVGPRECGVIVDATARQ